ncbi:hypothetical protein B0H12DRAFT_987017, partial [Mycena haematopus]
VNEGGKQILDLRARNEAIDLWNLKEFLRQGDARPNWSFFVDKIIENRWNEGESATNQGALYNIFLQNWHIPTWRKNPLTLDIRRMLAAAKKYNLEFTALSISNEIKLQMPIWGHIALIQSRFERIARKDSLKCLHRCHQTRTV